MEDVELYDHQVKAVAKMHNGCILVGGVGTGKSRTAMRYYIEEEAGRDIYVITTARKRDELDWETEAARHGVGTETSIPMAGGRLGDDVTLGRIKVDSWNNLYKYVDVENAFFIFDEQRVVGYGKWARVFIKIAKKNRWILLSATPGDTWMDYIPVFIANGFYKNKTEFTQEHVIWTPNLKFPKVLRYRAEGRLIKHRDSLIVEMPYERHTKRHINFVDVEYDKDLMKRVMDDRWHVYDDRPLRDVAELFSVMRRVVNSDPSRVQHVIQLLESFPRLIVFYNFDYELDLLRTLANGATQKSGPTKRSFSVSEWNGHNHDPIPETDSWLYLVQYTAGAEAWNCIDTNAMVFYSLSYSYRAFEQSQGRIDRLNTPFIDLSYFVFRSRSWIDGQIWKALERKEDFNARRASKELI